MNRNSRLAARLALAIGFCFALGACASKDFVVEQVSALEQRQAAVDYAQNDEMAKLSANLADALNRVNEVRELQQSGARLSTIADNVIVNFGLGSVKLSPEAQAQLAELATRLLAAEKDYHIEVQGHTDASGPAAVNDRVAMQRAEAVRTFLYRKGVPLRRISTISFGSEMPLMEAEDGSVEAGNRRAEIIVMQ